MGERVGVRACADENSGDVRALVCARACTCVIVLVILRNCGFVFLSSHFVQARVKCFFWVSARQSADRRQTVKMFEVVRSSLP